MYKVKQEARQRPNYLFPALCIAWAGFIIFQSLLPGESSGRESDFFVQLLNGVFKPLGIKPDNAAIIIRKSAHFLEYFIFALLIYKSERTFCRNGRINSYRLLFFCLLMPVCDEFVQSFSPGRSPEVRDVLIDFSGCIFLLVVNFAISLIKARLYGSKK